MINISFYHSQTLYSKVTIPLAISLNKKDFKVTFITNRNTIIDKLLGFKEFFHNKKPTEVNIISCSYLEYIAKLIDYEKEWKKERINFLFKQKIPLNTDVLVGTTKDIKKLKEFNLPKTLKLAIGYQHLPICLDLNKIKKNKKSFFSQPNKFTKFHKFKEIINKNYFFDCRFFYLKKKKKIQKKKNIF